MVTDKNLNNSLITASHSTQTIVVTSLEQSIWRELEARIALSLNRLYIEQLFEPTMLLFHQLVTNAMDALHFTVFKRIVDADFCINTAESDAALEMLYKDELAEHGDRNIAKFCEDNGLNLILMFPEEHDIIASIRVPAICKDAITLNQKLIDALGYQLRKQVLFEGSHYCVDICLKQETQLATVSRLPAKHSPILLTQESERDSLQSIFSQLGYGIVCFSRIGAILAVSPSIFASINLDATASSIQILEKSIPTHFYSDVIWGLALEEPNGKFGNYRIRVRSQKDSHSSMLFNVSGFRDEHSVTHTLWQAVSLDKNENNTLSEGSILNEARVHNITRNYVPQLVEEKAREVVRLGGHKLTNEECFLAVLFCDIVGFTTYVESNENKESVIHTLNSIFRRISKSVKDHGGLIDKFMGDCIMVLFRNPSDAVAAALEMQNHSFDINGLRERAGQEVLQLRIGIHWGKVVIGNVGTSERLDWTTIGDVVNTASRIEKNCRPDAVLISQALRNAIATVDEKHIDIKYGDIFHLQVKGKRNKIAVCYVFSS